MYGDEHIGIVAVGNGGTLAQLDELILFSRVDHFHIGKVFLDICSKLERDSQIERLFVGHLA